ncbi:hypothetical protein RDWZM_005930 [Blomia tropicalis]|uniref:Uncharacterized protein n=1 Tax=Blomia tropicalis TaxID=40697 RepID=A0A9Q0RLA5_BLOTA|nr:hypothetical protein RDWZM_005930 [Blomia tropicalis]
MESPIPISPGSTTSRRASSIFPQYLRRKSQRKDSTLVSESTTNLWPFMVEEKQPTLYDYQEQDKGTRGVGFKFGWVNGVYIRTVLNIWGVMLFLRMGWITGIQFDGYQPIMSNFHIIDEQNDTRLYATILLILIAIIPLIGMDWEAKTLFVLLMILLVAIVNYLVGTFIPMSKEQIAGGMTGWTNVAITANLWPDFNRVSVAEVFSVFFPSVIGIFAGASMSGDLRDPNEAIPKGTFLAILTTSSMYCLLVIFLGFTMLPYASGDYAEMVNILNPKNISCLPNNCSFGLTQDYQTMALSSAFSPLIYAGIYAATISSALGSYVCSPRIFQALCEDKLFPYIHYFAKGYGKANDPRRGYILTFLIALVFIMIGELNAIAPIISNFFMASFCLVNMACFHSSFVGSPSFRPTFKYYNQWVSLLTGLLCVAIMFFLDWISAVATIVIMGIINLYISNKQPDVDWGSSTRGHVYNNALSSALKLNYCQDHVKNFRPSILLLTGNPSARIPLVEFANNITKNRSLLMIGHITNFEIQQDIRERVINAQYGWMLKRKIKAFYILLEAASLSTGAKTLLQVAGLGRKLSANIIMIGYKSSWKDCIMEDLFDYYSIMLKALEMSVGICILRLQEGLDYADFFEQTPRMPDTSLNWSSPESPPFILKPIDERFDFEVNVVEESAESNNKSSKNQSSSNKSVNFPTTPNGLQQQASRTDRKLAQMKSLIPHDAMEAINQFSEKQPPGSIDIWWLTEDGGLTILIPYLLQINYLWSDCYIRVFAVAKSNEQVDQIQADMKVLLDRLRIPYTDVQVYSESDGEPSDLSKERFRSTIKKFLTKGDVAAKGKLTMGDLCKFEAKTSMYLRIRDLLLLHSKQATLVVMTLPLPHKDIMASLFMAWLETITENMPPFLFVRGRKNVIAI